MGEENPQKVQKYVKMMLELIVSLQGSVDAYFNDLSCVIFNYLCRSNAGCFKNIENQDKS